MPSGDVPVILLLLVLPMARLEAASKAPLIEVRRRSLEIGRVLLAVPHLAEPALVVRLRRALIVELVVIVFLAIFVIPIVLPLRWREMFGPAVMMAAPLQLSHRVPRAVLDVARVRVLPAVRVEVVRRSSLHRHLVVVQLRLLLLLQRPVDVASALWQVAALVTEVPRIGPKVAAHHLLAALARHAPRLIDAFVPVGLAGEGGVVHWLLAMVLALSILLVGPHLLLLAKFLLDTSAVVVVAVLRSIVGGARPLIVVGLIPSLL